MTKEEYEQCKIDQHSDDPLKAIQAQFILAMFPTEDTKYSIGSAEGVNDFLNKSADILRNTLEKHIGESQ